MPTGYTCSVQSGETTEFADFAMTCARAFGACISMRDSPSDAEIPSEFKPSSHHKERLAESRAELAKILAMTDREIAAAAEADYAEQVDAHRARALRRQTEKARYEAMLAKVAAWTPPTSEHIGLKDFMLEQLRSSIDHDCDGSYDAAPVLKTEWQWKENALERVERGIGYHTKSDAEEVERARGRTQWVSDLRKSLE